MPAPNLGQTVASAWEAIVSPNPEDQIFDEYWLLDNISKGAAFKSINGGRTINGPIEYAVNTTFRSYSDTETLDTTRIDVFDEFTFNWKEYAGTVVMSELEKAKNQGEGRKFDLLAAKLENLRNSARKSLNEGCFSDGTGNSSKDIGGLQHLVASSPSSGTVGGINRASQSWWRNQQSSGAKSSTAFDNLRSTMRTVYNNCSSGVHAKHPSFWVTDQTVFEGYESLLISNEQVTSKSKEQFDASFKNEYAMFKGIPGSYDEDCPSGSLFFLNTANLKLAYQKGYWMKGFPSVDPANQTIDVFKVMTIANLITNNPRRLGVITSIT
jgi:hypothetical protein